MSAVSTVSAAVPTQETLQTYIVCRSTKKWAKSICLSLFSKHQNTVPLIQRKLHQPILPSVDINEGPVGRDDDRDGEAERGHPDPH